MIRIGFLIRIIHNMIQIRNISIFRRFNFKCFIIKQKKSKNFDIDIESCLRSVSDVEPTDQL